jgi:hypothetical protein
MLCRIETSKKSAETIWIAKCSSSLWGQENATQKDSPAHYQNR